MCRTQQRQKKVLLSSPKQKRGNKGVVSQWTSFFLVPSPRPRDFVPSFLLVVPNVTLPLLSDCCSGGPRAEQRKLFSNPSAGCFLPQWLPIALLPVPLQVFLKRDINDDDDDGQENGTEKQIRGNGGRNKGKEARETRILQSASLHKENRKGDSSFPSTSSLIPSQT